ncbi:beta-ketoacyl-ACP synthase III [Actinokineospora sp. NPDC004072]
MTAAVVTGVGATIPPRVVTNDDLAVYLDTSDEWIRSRTGIASRRWVDPGVSTGDLAVEAGALALRSAGLDRVDAVVVATTTPDRLCPATAPEVATRLGMTGISAHDVNAVCTGFLYGLASAVGLIAAGNASTVLMIGAEAFSTILDPRDRSTAVIFADGAGALVLRAGTPDEPGAVGPIVLGSDGSLSDLIQIPAGGSRQRSAGTIAPPEDHFFRMRGREVYRHAVERMAASAQEAMVKAGLSMADVDKFVPHQANNRISVAVGERLGLRDAQTVSNVDHMGNTAAASIGVLLAEASLDGALHAGDRLLLTAFGGGLTWGATTFVWPTLTPHMTVLPQPVAAAAI